VCTRAVVQNRFQEETQQPVKRGSVLIERLLKTERKCDTSVDVFLGVRLAALCVFSSCADRYADTNVQGKLFWPKLSCSEPKVSNVSPL